MRDALDGEIAKREAAAAQERESCVKALETLVVKHDLPGAVSDMQLVLVAGGRYAGRARMKTGFGLEALVDLEVPTATSSIGSCGVDRLMERLDVQAPEVGGWLHKEVKRRPQHLEKLHVTEFSGGAEGGVVKLRLGPDGTGAGSTSCFRTRRRACACCASPIRRTGRASSRSTSTTRTRGSCWRSTASSRRRRPSWRVTGGVRRREGGRRGDTDARKADAAARAADREDGAGRPGDRGALAFAGELILRRLLAGDRREEIFLSKAELKQKLDPLNDANRGLFDPLWVSALPSASAKAAPVETAPAAGSAPHTQTGKYRPMTPALGSAPLNASSAPAAVAAPVSGPPPAPAAAALPRCPSTRPRATSCDAR